jgi:hypothetical protein
MNGSQLKANEASDVRTVQRTKLITNFSGHPPPFDVTSIVYRMLKSVPKEYLNGLNAVVITSTDSLSRERLKSKTKSRKRTVKIAQAAGLYHPAWNGESAWVEIFVDQILKNATKGWFKPPFEREWLLSSVLFHEIGHHIHATRRPEFREREDVAEKWRGKLTAMYFRKKYPWMLMLVHLKRCFRVFSRSR